MNTAIPNRSFEDISKSIHEARSQPMTREDGYLWGLEYLQDIKKELLKLEKRARDRNDPRFFNAVKSSMLQAIEVEEELEGKLVNNK